MFALWPPHQIKHQIDYNNCGLLCFAQHSKKTQGNSYSLLSWMMTITIFQKSAFLKFVRHFLVEFVMQLFLHNSDMLISNLPHAKLYSVFFLLKIEKQKGRQNL